PLTKVKGEAKVHVPAVWICRGKSGGHDSMNTETADFGQMNKETLTPLIPPLSEAATIVELLRRRARYQPDARAYTFLEDGEEESNSLTYAELDRQAQSIAVFLQTVANTRERAVLLYPAGLDFIAAFFGCLYAGWIAVPAYPPQPARLSLGLSRLRAIIADGQPLVALTDAKFLSKASAMLEHAPELKALKWRATNVLVKEPATKWRDP